MGVVALRHRYLAVFLATPTIAAIIYSMNRLRQVHSFRSTVNSLQLSPPPRSFSSSACSLRPSRLLSPAFPPTQRRPSPRVERMSLLSGSPTSAAGSSAHQRTQQGSSPSNISSSPGSRQLVVVIAGPTASGKSDVAARLCRPRNQNQKDDTSDKEGDGHIERRGVGGGGIIVSADSVQAYRGVHIGANKPSTDERVETPHILIDVADCEESYNAADWCNDALMTIEALLDPSASAPAQALSRATPATTTSPQNNDEEPTATEKRQALILDTIQKARKDKGYDEQQSLLPVVCGGTMMYLTWLVHGRPDAMRPSPTAVQIAKETIESFQTRNIGAGTSDENNGDAKIRSKSNYQAAVDHVSSFGPIFEQRTKKFCGEDWYRLRRTLEIALTVQEQQQQQSQQQTILDNNDNNGPGPTDSIAEKLFTGEREGGLPSSGYDVRCFFLCPDDRMKHARIIDERCEQMIMKGLLKETADLYLNDQLPEMAERAIGYRQTLDYLLRDNDDNNGLEDMNESTQKQKEAELFESYLNEFTTATRRYAKKQMSWFRKDEDFIFVPVLLEDSVDKSSRVEHSAKIIERLCKLSREEYESELYGFLNNTTSNDNKDGDGGDVHHSGSIESQSMQIKKKNESQAKGMKFYQFERHILKPDSDIYNEVLSEAIELRQRIRRQKKRKIDIIN